MVGGTKWATWCCSIITHDAAKATAHNVVNSRHYNSRRSKFASRRHCKLMSWWRCSSCCDNIALANVWQAIMDVIVEIFVFFYSMAPRPSTATRMRISAHEREKEKESEKEQKGESFETCSKIPALLVGRNVTTQAPSCNNTSSLR